MSKKHPDSFTKYPTHDFKLNCWYYFPLPFKSGLSFINHSQHQCRPGPLQNGPLRSTYIIQLFFYSKVPKSFTFLQKQVPHSNNPTLCANFYSSLVFVVIRLWPRATQVRKCLLLFIVPGNHSSLRKSKAILKAGL